MAAAPKAVPALRNEDSLFAIGTVLQLDSHIRVCSDAAPIRSSAGSSTTTVRRLNPQRPRHSPDRVRADLAARLRSRRAEIEEAILCRARAISDRGSEDAEYVEGLRAAVAAAIDFGLSAVELGEERCGQVPPALLTQARHAARKRVELETVLRRYMAGYTALADFLIDEVRGEAVEMDGTLYRAQRELAALFDRIVTVVSAEYRTEAEQAMRPHGERVAGRVKRLLAGELIDTGSLGYDLTGWHLAAIATGGGAERVLRDLAAALDRRLLLVRDGEQAVWAWLGSRRRLEPDELAGLPSTAADRTVSLGFGEPAQDLGGWRLTHRQAATAFTEALRRPPAQVRYADVALIAGIQRDPDLVAFLTDSYLTPLAGGRDDGGSFRSTLSAYFSAGRNVASAAAALGVTRQTVHNRLNAVEERLGRPIGTCAAEIEAALKLTEFG